MYDLQGKEDGSMKRNYNHKKELFKKYEQVDELYMNEWFKKLHKKEYSNDDLLRYRNQKLAILKEFEEVVNNV